MTPRAKRTIAVLVALLLALLVWPTRWVYVTTGATLYRIDRVTGCYQMATDRGWSRPWQQTC
jgi:hypothetical protein